MRVALLARCSSAARRSSTAPLASLRAAQLAHSKTAPPTAKLDLDIAHPDAGGHALLGSNGCGKSLVGKALVDDAHLHGGTVERPLRTAHVSFEAHEALVKEDVSVFEALGKLQTKASKYLAVRFGLHPLLWRPVRAVSTGEVRKVLLARALATRPDLIVLDNAFDGLDAPSREALAKLLSQMSKGWGDILVQDMPSAKEAARTQLLQVTHRASEVLPEVTRLTWLSDDGAVTENASEDDLEARLLESTTRRDVRPVEELIADLAPPAPKDEVLVEAHNLGVTTDKTTILEGVDWTVLPGEHWLVAGGNGAGKSTLASLLTRPDQGDLRWGPAATRPIDGALRTTPSAAWVSTELHLRASSSREPASAMLALFGAEDAPACRFAAGLGLRALERPFYALSQGEQKLVLVAAAVASTPRLLILDEVTQGLDAFYRKHVLDLAEAYAAHGTLVFVTHHTNEHLPCLTHVLHLAKDSKPAYCGPRAGWDPRIT